VPRSLEQFRVWADDNLKLEVIGSKSTLYQPWNVNVRGEVLKLIKSLTSLEKTSANRKNKTDRVKEENRELKFTLKQLAGEMHKTRQELLTAERDGARKDQRITDLKEENSKLTAKLKERSGLYSVK
jgi:septal ring factor EnvC (AmiA/AmiB activator)